MFNLKRDAMVRRNLTNIIGKYFLEMEKIYSKFDADLAKYSDKLFSDREIIYDQFTTRLEQSYREFGEKLFIKESKYKLPPIHTLFETLPTYMNRVIDRSIGLIEELVSFNYKLIEIEEEGVIASPKAKKLYQEISDFLTFDEEDKGKLLNEEINSTSLFHILNKEIRYRIGKILLDGNQMKDVTPETIATDKYPTIDRLIMSVFIYDLEEEPYDQKVSDIITDIHQFDTMRGKLKELLIERNPKFIDKIKSIEIKSILDSNNERIIAYIEKKKEWLTLNTNPDLIKRLEIFNVMHRILSNFVPYLLYLSNMTCELNLVALKLDNTVQGVEKALAEKYKESIN